MIVAIVLFVLLIVAIVGYFQLRRHGESPVPSSTWERTDEVFRDPSSGRLMRVWIEPADGSRHYVPERGAN